MEFAFLLLYLNTDKDWKRRDVKLLQKERVVRECGGLIWLRAAAVNVAGLSTFD